MFLTRASLSRPSDSEKASSDSRRLALLDDIFWDAAARLATVCRNVPSPDFCKSLEELSFQTILNHAKTEGALPSFAPRPPKPPHPSQ